MYPDDENGNIDRKNPDHKNQDGVCVVVEIIMGARLLALFSIDN